MKQNIKTNIVLIAICAWLLASFFLSLASIRFVAAGILLISAVTVSFLVKKRSILSFNSRKVLLIITVSAAVFLMIYYISGLFCGFEQALHRLSVTTLWKHIAPICVIIVSSEIIRYTALAEGGKTKYLLVYLIGVLSEITIQNEFLYFDNVNRFMEFVGLTLFPALTVNLLLNYTAKSYGFFPGIIYRAVMVLYPYFLPITPLTPNILPAFILLLLPLLLRAFLRGLFEKKRPMAKLKKNAWMLVVSIILIIISLLFVMLVSCQFRYGIIVIGSGSMADEINTGDAVIYEAYENDEIQKNDIIIFEKDAYSRTVHRVIETIDMNGQTRYITKGDANEEADYGYVTEEQIVGVVKFKIPYIGYPSIWLKDIFND